MIRRNRFLLSTAACIVTVALTAHAKLKTVSAPETSIVAKVDVNAPLMDFEAKSSSVAGQEKDGKLYFMVPLSTLSTGSGTRDEHMRDALNASKHKNATLVLDKSKLKSPEDGKKAKGSVSGQFGLNGKTKPVSVSYTVSRTGSDFHVTASFTVNIQSHGIPKPCDPSGNICVTPNIPITVTMKLRDS